MHRPPRIALVSLLLLCAGMVQPAPPDAEPIFIDGSTAFGANHAISGDGNHVVFESASDLIGENSDGNGELFRWSDGGGVLQLTDTYDSTYYFEIDVNSDGTVVMVAADADITDSGATQTEIYRWTQGAGWTRLTFTSGPTSIVFIGGMGISSDGTRLMFTSRGDYTGNNPTGEEQVFLWDHTSGFTQITYGDPCGTGGGNFGIDLSGTGDRILFSSRCQYGDWNPDLNADLFLWDEATGIRPLTNEASIAVGASGTVNHDGTVAALSSSNDLVNGGYGSAAHLFRWVDGCGFEQLTTIGIDNRRCQVNATGDRIAFSASNGQGTGGNPEEAPELFLWEEGYPIVELTDSEQNDTSWGNERPDLDDRGTRLSMTALRAFDAPHDMRTGYFVLNLWLFYDDLETGSFEHWTAAVP